MSNAKIDPELDLLKPDLEEAMYLCSVRKFPRPARAAKIDVILLKFQAILDRAISKTKAEVLVQGKAGIPIQPSTFNLQPSATPDVLSSLKKMPRAKNEVDVSTLQPSTFNSVELWAKARKEGRSWNQIQQDKKLNPRGVSFQYIAREVSKFLSNNPGWAPK